MIFLVETHDMSICLSYLSARVHESYLVLFLDSHASKHRKLIHSEIKRSQLETGICKFDSSSFGRKGPIELFHIIVSNTDCF